MKNPRIFVVLLVVLLAGCATGGRVGPEETIKVGRYTVKVQGLDGFVANSLTTLSLPNPHAPNVFITPNRLIVVDQEPIRPTVFTGGSVVISWALDKDSDYSFPGDSAVSFPTGYNGPPPDLQCRAVGPKKKVIVCTYTSDPSTRGHWKYAITVQDKNGVPLTTLDPWISQD